MSRNRRPRIRKVDPRAKIHWTLEVPDDSLELGVIAWGANARGDAIALHVVDTGKGQDVFLVGLVGGGPRKGALLDSRHRKDQYALRTILPVTEWPTAVEVTCRDTLRSSEGKPHSRVDPDIDQLVRNRLMLNGA